jgi:hypothetical protein
MIKTEIVAINGKEFKRTFSDGGFLIRNVVTNRTYIDAVDLITSNYVYEETATPIETNEQQSE